MNNIMKLLYKIIIKNYLGVCLFRVFKNEFTPEMEDVFNPMDPFNCRLVKAEQSRLESNRE